MNFLNRLAFTNRWLRSLGFILQPNLQICRGGFMLKIFAVIITVKRTRPTSQATIELFELWRRSTHPTLRDSPRLGGDFYPDFLGFSYLKGFGDRT
jgi:hypothetical protein